VGEHSVGARQIHHDWDRDREPVLSIRPGDVVRRSSSTAG
jgi:hypothetical protein